MSKQKKHTNKRRIDTFRLQMWGVSIMIISGILVVVVANSLHSSTLRTASLMIFGFITIVGFVMGIIGAIKMVVQFYKGA